MNPVLITLSKVSYLPNNRFTVIDFEIERLGRTTLHFFSKVKDVRFERHKNGRKGKKGRKRKEGKERERKERKRVFRWNLKKI